MQICHQIPKGFNNPKQHHTVAVALDVSKAFDTVNTDKSFTQLTLTNIPIFIIKFIVNYIKGQQACAQFNLAHSQNSNKSTLRIPQSGVWSPTLFKIYISGLPSPKRHTYLNISR